MVSEVDAMYAETQGETGFAAMSPAVRAALGKVERHRLVPASQAAAAYRNHPLPIGSGQTISQPYIVALSTDLLDLDSGSTVLDVGTGSGYQAAVLAEIAAKVFSIELIEPLGEASPIHGFLAKNPAGGQHHICYEVPDIHEAKAWFEGKGAKVLGEPRIGAHGTPIFFVHPKDMGGVLTEIMESPGGPNDPGGAH